ncbi:MAG: ATP-dependent RNA helicase HrpA [Lentisphaeria bacterium]|nr:ATP-dependent RNA helicase HrpA [Lentisphaeria bacterium]
MAVSSLTVTYPPQLPIASHIQEIREAWSRSNVIIIGGATGSGKTTQLPKVALELLPERRGWIGCTQPRRIAAMEMARRVASELDVELGQEVGCQVRFENRTSPATAVKFMTDGILLAEIRHDRLLRKYDAIIIDEAHERSLNIDFLLGYLKDLLPKRPDLKVAISSATLDLALFSRFFDDAPVIEVEGRTFPVEDVFMEPLHADEELDEHVARAVEYLSRSAPNGDILVFLPGEREIRECAELLNGRKWPKTEILPLFARLNSAEQQKVFHPGSRRRIVLATNVAETSITIPRIRFCIDSGLARVSRYNPRNRIQELQIERISQASSRQRRGRCGRVSNGVCVHLCAEEEWQQSPLYTDPEIRRTSLAGVILQMAALGLPRIDRFPFIDPPPPALIREGMRTLEDLNAIRPGGEPTRIGRMLAGMPIDPQLGRMLAAGQEAKVLRETIVTAAFLSIADPRERPLKKQRAADEAHRQYRDERSDFLAILNLYRAMELAVGDGGNGPLRRFCKANYLNFSRMREWRNLTAELLVDCVARHWHPAAELPASEDVPYEAFHCALLAGVPRQIARYVPEYRYFLGTGGRKFTIFPGSGLAGRKKPPEWMMSFALVETSRLFGRQNAEIRPEWLYRVAPHLCRVNWSRAAWDPRSGFVQALEHVTSGGLVLTDGKRVHYGESHPVEARAIFIREALVTGALTLPGWPARQAALIRKLERLEQKIRRPGTVFDPEAVMQFYDAELPSWVCSVSDVKKWQQQDRGDHAMKPADAMQVDSRDLNLTDYPDELTFSGHRFRVGYTYEPGADTDGLTLYAREDEVELLPPWALDWLVPGYLPEKAACWFRALNKDQRRRLAPLADRLAEFLEAWRRGAVVQDQLLVNAVCDFLEVSPDDFAEPRFPEYLQMKLALLNDRNEIRQILRELPGICSRRGAMLGAGIRGVSGHTRSGLVAWPEDCELPVSVPLPGTDGRMAYPALVAEKQSVGTGLFLQQSEADLRHAAGLCRLFSLRNGSQIDFIRRRLKFPKEMLLSWFLNDHERRYPVDFTAAALLEAMGGEPESIRDAAAFHAAEIRAKEELGGCADRMMLVLTDLYGAYTRLEKALEPLTGRAVGMPDDLRAQLDLLFAPGFLRRPAVWRDYRRYLRAATLRADRLLGNPGKDREKSRILEDWNGRFAAALNAVDDLCDSPGLYAFWQLLEEARIAVFAPEQPLRIKTPVHQLDQAWKELRF